MLFVDSIGLLSMQTDTESFFLSLLMSLSRYNRVTKSRFGMQFKIPLALQGGKEVMVICSNLDDA